MPLLILSLSIVFTLFGLSTYELICFETKRSAICFAATSVIIFVACGIYSTMGL